MDAVANVKKKPDLKARQVHIVGKVLRSRRWQESTYTTIVCPAADEYSKPQIVEIRGARKFAEKDDVVSIVAQLGGFEGRAFEARDKDSGEVTRVIPVTITLDFVDLF